MQERVERKCIHWLFVILYYRTTRGIGLGTTWCLFVNLILGGGVREGSKAGLRDQQHQCWRGAQRTNLLLLAREQRRIYHWHEWGRHLGQPSCHGIILQKWNIKCNEQARKEPTQDWYCHSSCATALPFQTSGETLRLRIYTWLEKEISWDEIAVPQSNSKCFTTQQQLIAERNTSDLGGHADVVAAEVSVFRPVYEFNNASSAPPPPWLQVAARTCRRAYWSSTLQVKKN